VDRDSQGYGRMDMLNFGTLKILISVISAKKTKVPKLKRPGDGSIRNVRIKMNVNVNPYS